MNACVYTIHIDRIEGGYLATAPALPGCLAQAETYEEALLSAQEAITGYLEHLRAEGSSIPVEPDPTQPLRVGVHVDLPTIR